MDFLAWTPLRWAARPEAGGASYSTYHGEKSHTMLSQKLRSFKPFLPNKGMSHR
jgi:hypothetical protein